VPMALNRLVRMLACATLVVISFGAAPAAFAQERAGFDAAPFAVGFEPVASGFDDPVYVTEPNDGSGRLFVVERPGRVKIVDGGTVLAEPFLDITNLVESGGSEQGLLSVAFPDDFAESGALYVYYTARRAGESVGDNTIARYRVTGEDPNRADVGSAEVLLRLPDRRVNHNGGQLQFGPDGYLYASLGDGGGGGDPRGNGQNPHTLFGSVIRVDASAATEPYDIPADNPFADGAGGAPEVWVFGLRNPWRFSFDRETGDFFTGDVGQNAIEEVDWLPAGTAGGVNFGWSVMEGSVCFRADVCDKDGLAVPIAEYSHDFGCSVVGGYVYRGEQEPALDGVYLFGDFCSGLVWGLGRDEAGEWALSEPIDSGLSISSFGEDAAGEVYLVDLAGTVYRVTDGESS
jgi:glucose/arabinose dehydrogenase